jgi:hypothetical protein
VLHPSSSAAWQRRHPRQSTLETASSSFWGPGFLSFCQLETVNHGVIARLKRTVRNRSFAATAQSGPSLFQDQFGNTAAPEMCGLSSTDSAAIIRACNVAPCSDYYFSPGPWSVCNAPCQWGHATRDVPCIQRATNATVDPSLCYGGGSLCSLRPEAVLGSSREYY